MWLKLEHQMLKTNIVQDESGQDKTSLESTIREISRNDRKVPIESMVQLTKVSSDTEYHEVPVEVLKVMKVDLSSIPKSYLKLDPTELVSVEPDDAPSVIKVESYSLTGIDKAFTASTPDQSKTKNEPGAVRVKSKAKGAGNNKTAKIKPG